MDKLRQIGINYYNEIWHLSNGGNPISTPELFLYNILKLLQRQVIECFLYPPLCQRMFENFKYIKYHQTWASIILNRIKALNHKDGLLNREGGSYKSSFANSIRKFVRKEEPYNQLLKQLESILKKIEKWSSGNKEGTKDIIVQVTDLQKFNHFAAPLEIFTKTIKTFLEVEDETTIENIIDQNKNEVELGLDKKNILKIPDNIAQMQT